MKECNIEARIWQIEASLMRIYLEKFCVLENNISFCFIRDVNKLNLEIQNELLFYAAHMLSVKNYDFKKKEITTSSVKFSKARKFSCFSAARILKLQKNQTLLQVFNFNIQSINTKMLTLPFIDCCEKLLNVRNKLAHERNTLNLNYQDAIELLSDSEILHYEHPCVSITHIDEVSNNSKILLSNIFFMDNIISELDDKINVEQ